MSDPVKLTIERKILGDDGTLEAGMGQTFIVDANCYTEKVVWKGRADVRRPNTRRPFYYKTIVRVPTMYRLGGMIICHPVIAEQIRRGIANMQQRMADQVDAMAYGFGFALEKPAPFPIKTGLQIMGDWTPIPPPEQPSLNWTRFGKDMAAAFTPTKIVRIENVS